MKTNIFIPEKLNVGFQERKGTYTGKLAYVIYYDQKGVLRKEASWNSWRDKKIDALPIDNVPTSGFVLNKKAGGYDTGWNHRQTYVRVYDPRGFEFEIEVPNLLYILENTNSIKGKGLEGEFVYGWDGKELVLIPTESPDYIELTEFNKILFEKNYVKAKELILGATYKTKQNEELIYMGRFDSYDSYYNTSQGKKYFFCHKTTSYDGKPYNSYIALKSLGDKIIGVISKDCVENYIDLMDELESKRIYSPYDPSKDEYIKLTFNKFSNKLKDSNWTYCFIMINNDITSVEIMRGYPDREKFKIERYGNYGRYDLGIQNDMTLEDLYEKYKPMYKNKYLANGKLYEKECMR